MFTFVNRSSIDTPAAELNQGSIIGIWRIGEPIARSQRHTIYNAQPADATSNPRWDYALKTPALTNQETIARTGARSFTSAVAASVVKHPNLITIVDSSTSASQPYVVMPRLEGITLQQRCLQSPDVTLPMAVWWTRQLAEALASLHADRFVHADIHPGHVLISPSGHVTLLDLGHASPQHTSLPITFRGTTPFASPELSSGRFAATSSMDVYSLGKVLQHCLNSVRGIDKDLSQLLESMLANDPSARPTAKMVEQRLRMLELSSLVHQIRPTAVPRSTRRAA